MQIEHLDLTNTVLQLTALALATQIISTVKNLFGPRGPSLNQLLQRLLDLAEAYFHNRPPPPQITENR